MNSRHKGLKKWTKSTLLAFLLALFSVPAFSVVWAQNQNPFTSAIPQGSLPYNPFSGGGSQGQGFFDQGSGGAPANPQEGPPIQGAPSWYDQVAPSGPMGSPGQMGMPGAMGPPGQMPGSFGGPGQMGGIPGPMVTPGPAGGPGQMGMPGQMSPPDQMGGAGSTGATGQMGMPGMSK